MKLESFKLESVKLESLKFESLEFESFCLCWKELRLDIIWMVSHNAIEIGIR